MSSCGYNRVRRIASASHIIDGRRAAAEGAAVDEFYARDRYQILLPPRRQERPNREFLEWHQDAVYLAS